MNNKLFYGDNLDILRNRDYFPNECVDLIYLDPPFNSNRNYNVLFRDESGTESEAQITAFEDTWHWGENAEETYFELVTHAPANVSAAINAMLTLIGRNQMMAYLVMMTARLVELHRVLKPTGSLYLHCDPTASHYLKIMLDAIFGVQNFRNEIVWKRTGAHSSTRGWGPIHDIILYYTKSDVYIWNQQYQDYSNDYVENFYRKEDARGNYQLVSLTAAGVRSGDSGQPWKGVNPTEKGRHWAIPRKTLERFISKEKANILSTQEKLDILEKEGYIVWPKKGSTPRYKRYSDETPGTSIQDVITDILPLSAHAKERLGYPTQKPVSLLERIIAASSNPGDVCLDSFCGCGSAISAAQKLGRKWIGIDITHLSISLQKYRLKNEFDLEPKRDYEVIGEPTTVQGARALATDTDNDGRYQFQFWALSLLQAKPLGGDTGSRKGKKGADKGVDGLVNFFDGNGSGNPKAQEVVVQVKSGKVKSGDIRDLRGTMERRKSAIGVFITLEPPTKEMETEAVAAGYYESSLWGKKYRKVQIFTIEQLLNGASVEMPPQHGTFKQAQRVQHNEGKQLSFLGETGDD